MASNRIDLEVIDVAVIVGSTVNPLAVLDLKITGIGRIAVIIHLNGGNDTAIGVQELQRLNVGQGVNALIAAIDRIGPISQCIRENEPTL